MFDVRFLASPLVSLNVRGQRRRSYETSLKKFLYLFDRPLFWPAAALNTDTCNRYYFHFYAFLAKLFFDVSRAVSYNFNYADRDDSQEHRL